MMTKTAYYMQMAQEAAAQITGSKEQWTAFLTTSARLYKVEAGVKAVRRVLQRGLERGKIAFLVRRQRRDLRQAVGEHPAAELLVERR